MPSPTDQKNEPSAIMLCPILIPQPETTPLEEGKYQDLQNAIDGGFSTGNLVDAHANQAYEALSNTCMTDEQFEQISHLVNPRLALTIKLASLSRFGITTTAWDKDHHPETLRRLEENPPLIRQSSNSAPMTKPDNNLAVLTDGSDRNRTNSLIDQVSEWTNRTLVMSTTQVPSEALLFKTIPKNCFTIALNGQTALYDTNLSQNFRDETMDESASGNQVHD